MLSLAHLVLAAALAETPRAAASAPAAASDAGLLPEAVIELVVEDLKGKPVRDLQGSEVILKQDGEPELVRALSFRAEDAVYELRYRPTRGRLGAITIRLLRPGTKPRGPHGPFVTAHWVETRKDYEKPLLAALSAPGETHGLECDIAVLRFENNADGVHHAVVFDIPPGQVRCPEVKGQRSCRVAMMARVLTEAGRVVGKQSVEHELPAPPPTRRGSESTETALDGWAVWAGHFHLHPGHYNLETVVLNGGTSRKQVRRTALDVATPASGLRMSSVVALRGAEDLMPSENVADNPLRLGEAALIPTVKGQFIAGSEGYAQFYVVLYPNRSSAEPVACQFELYRDGTLVGRRPLPLHPPSATGEISYYGGLDLRTLLAAHYDVKLVATQGAERVEEGLTLILDPPPRAY